MKQLKNIFSTVRIAIGAILTVGITTSCEHIFDDIEACKYGVNLRFVYDYNMEFANAFPKKVDCLTLFVYDDDGNFVTSRTETSEWLEDEQYRMVLDLKPGNYKFVAYGGLACEASSFTLTHEPSEGSLMSDLGTTMKSQNQVSDKQLHHFFFGPWDTDETKLFDGATTVTIPDMLPGEIPLAERDNYKNLEQGEVYVNHTIKMMKNTNNIRIVLQQLSGEPLDNDEFIYYITDDNTLLADDNTVKPNGGITYSPWVMGHDIAGATEAGDKEVVVGFAEFSTSRLVTTNGPRLVIVRKDRGTDIVNIPLNEYLLLLKSELYSDMDDQEFLDRQSEWSLVFFLDSKYEWIKTRIIINDWVVRINNSKL